MRTLKELIEYWRNVNWTKQPDGSYTTYNHYIGEVKVSQYQIDVLDKTTIEAYRLGLIQNESPTN